MGKGGGCASSVPAKGPTKGAQLGLVAMPATRLGVSTRAGSSSGDQGRRLMNNGSLNNRTPSQAVTSGSAQGDTNKAKQAARRGSSSTDFPEEAAAAAARTVPQPAAATTPESSAPEPDPSISGEQTSSSSNSAAHTQGAAEGSGGSDGKDRQGERKDKRKGRESSDAAEVSNSRDLSQVPYHRDSLKERTNGIGQEAASRHVSDCALSLSFLSTFSKQLEDSELSTAEVVQKLVLPLTSGLRCRMVDMVKAEQVGTPHYYVIHRWASPFKHLALSLRGELEERRQVDPEATRLWLDCFAISQHPHSQKEDLAGISDAIKKADNVLLLLDPAGKALGRLWVLYELWKAISLKGEGKLQVLVTDEASPGPSGHDRYMAIDVGSAQASSEADAARILQEISQGPGAPQVNAAIQQALASSAQEAARRAAALLPDDPLGFSTAAAQSAAVLRICGQMDEAADLYQAAYEAADQTLPKGHPSRLPLLLALARVRAQQERPADAEALYKAVGELTAKASGLKHPDTLTALFHMAEAIHAQGRSQEALHMGMQVLMARKGLLGAKHPDCARSMDSCAIMLTSLGDPESLAKAEDMLALAAEVWEVGGKPEAPELAAALDHLAAVLKLQGRREEAEKRCKKALRIREKALGPQHPDTAASLNQLGMLLAARGQGSDAMALYTRAVAIKQAVQGPNHPDVAGILVNMGLLHQEAGRLFEAEALDRRALDICSQRLGPSHPLTATCANNLAMVLQQQGRLSEAAPLFEQAVQVHEELYGKGHAATRPLLVNYASLLDAMGQHEQAHDLLSQAASGNLPTSPSGVPEAGGSGAPAGRGPPGKDAHGLGGAEGERPITPMIANLIGTGDAASSGAAPGSQGSGSGAAAGAMPSPSPRGSSSGNGSGSAGAAAPAAARSRGSGSGSGHGSNTQAPAGGSSSDRRAPALMVVPESGGSFSLGNGYSPKTPTVHSGYLMNMPMMAGARNLAPLPPRSPAGAGAGPQPRAVQELMQDFGPGGAVGGGRNGSQTRVPSFLNPKVAAAVAVARPLAWENRKKQEDLDELDY